MSNCGCPYCSGRGVPNSRDGWVKLKNKSGHMYGNTAKTCKHKRHRTGKVVLNK